MDMESLHPIDPWLKKYPCFVSQEPYEHPVLDGNFEHLAINALIGCIGAETKNILQDLLLERSILKALNMQNLHQFCSVFCDF
jgi:hypothetical protein